MKKQILISLAFLCLTNTTFASDKDLKLVISQKQVELQGLQELIESSPVKNGYKVVHGGLEFLAGSIITTWRYKSHPALKWGYRAVGILLVTDGVVEAYVAGENLLIPNKDVAKILKAIEKKRAEIMEIEKALETESDRP